MSARTKEATVFEFTQCRPTGEATDRAQYAMLNELRAWCSDSSRSPGSSPRCSGWSERTIASTEARAVSLTARFMTVRETKMIAAVSKMVSQIRARMRLSIEFSRPTVTASPSPCAATFSGVRLKRQSECDVGLDEDEQNASLTSATARPDAAEVLELHLRLDVGETHRAGDDDYAEHRDRERM